MIYISRLHLFVCSKTRSTLLKKFTTRFLQRVLRTNYKTDVSLIKIRNEFFVENDFDNETNRLGSRPFIISINDIDEKHYLLCIGASFQKRRELNNFLNEFRFIYSSDLFSQLFYTAEIYNDNNVKNLRIFNSKPLEMNDKECWQDFELIYTNDLMESPLTIYIHNNVLKNVLSVIQKLNSHRTLQQLCGNVCKNEFSVKTLDKFLPRIIVESLTN